MTVEQSHSNEAEAITSSATATENDVTSSILTNDNTKSSKDNLSEVINYDRPGYSTPPAVIAEENGSVSEISQQRSDSTEYRSPQLSNLDQRLTNTRQESLTHLADAIILRSLLKQTALDLIPQENHVHYLEAEKPLQDSLTMLLRSMKGIAVNELSVGGWNGEARSAIQRAKDRKLKTCSDNYNGGARIPPLMQTISTNDNTGNAEISNANDDVASISTEQDSAGENIMSHAAGAHNNDNQSQSDESNSVESHVDMQEARFDEEPRQGMSPLSMASGQGANRRSRIEQIEEVELSNNQSATHSKDVRMRQLIENVRSKIASETQDVTDELVQKHIDDAIKNAHIFLERFKYEFDTVETPLPEHKNLMIDKLDIFAIFIAVLTGMWDEKSSEEEDGNAGEEGGTSRLDQIEKVATLYAVQDFVLRIELMGLEEVQDSSLAEALRRLGRSTAASHRDNASALAISAHIAMDAHDESIDWTLEAKLDSTDKLLSKMILYNLAGKRMITSVGSFSGLLAAYNASCKGEERASICEIKAFVDRYASLQNLSYASITVKQYFDHVLSRAAHPDAPQSDQVIAREVSRVLDVALVDEKYIDLWAQAEAMPSHELIENCSKQWTRELKPLLSARNRAGKAHRRMAVRSITSVFHAPAGARALRDNFGLNCMMHYLVGAVIVPRTRLKSSVYISSLNEKLYNPSELTNTGDDLEFVQDLAAAVADIIKHADKLMEKERRFWVDLTSDITTPFEECITCLVPNNNDSREEISLSVADE